MEPEFDRSWKSRLSSFLTQTWRVLLVTRKPSWEEYNVVVKITGLGILALGAIGFLLQVSKTTLFG